jgi:cation diffusion facilitator CzcD-associated flavoprotein CzcO
MRALIIGAGPAGLAIAACLGRRGISCQILDRAAEIGSAWRGHYDRLHLHTARGRSGLPFMPMPRSVGRYPSRGDVIKYLEDYAERFALDIRLNCTVRSVERAPDGWTVTHDDGVIEADAVIFATGLNGAIHWPDWPGQPDFPGTILHSSEYRNPAPFAGQSVLVVGFGNSGADIATDLAQAGVTTGLCVRGPVNLLPKEILGVPVTSLGLLGKIFAPHIADTLTAPVVRAHIGRPEDYGMRQADKGPLRQVVEDGKIPMIDVGALTEIKAGRIAVHPGIERFDHDQARFSDGTTAHFDAVILATGYRVDLRGLLPDMADKVLDAAGRPLVSGGPSGQPGLYFCSYIPSPNGQIRQAGVEAKAIARDLARNSERSGSGI